MEIAYGPPRGGKVGVIDILTDNAGLFRHPPSARTAMKQTLLIELGCEDLPARYMAAARPDDAWQAFVDEWVAAK